MDKSTLNHQVANIIGTWSELPVCPAWYQDGNRDDWTWDVRSDTCTHGSYGDHVKCRPSNDLYRHSGLGWCHIPNYLRPHEAYRIAEHLQQAGIAYRIQFHPKKGDHAFEVDGSTESHPAFAYGGSPAAFAATEHEALARFLVQCSDAHLLGQ